MGLLGELYDVLIGDKRERVRRQERYTIAERLKDHFDLDTIKGNTMYQRCVENMIELVQGPMKIAHRGSYMRWN